MWKNRKEKFEDLIYFHFFDGYSRYSCAMLKGIKAFTYASWEENK